MVVASAIVNEARTSTSGPRNENRFPPCINKCAIRPIKPASRDSIHVELKRMRLSGKLIVKKISNVDSQTFGAVAESPLRSDVTL